jgi:uncharacterized damage-inducible protein DinB
MTHADLVLLIDFNYWARDRVLDAACRLTPDQYTRDLGSSFPSVRDTLVHIYSSEWIWYQRWQGTSAGMLDPTRYPDVEALRTEWLEHESRVRAFVAALDDAAVERVIEYRSLRGEPQRSAIWEMVQHVVNHGTYHRGQVTTMLRQLGSAPPGSMDLIAYHRQRRGSAVQG